MFSSRKRKVNMRSGGRFNEQDGRGPFTMYTCIKLPRYTLQISYNFICQLDFDKEEFKRERGGRREVEPFMTCLIFLLS